MAKKLKEVHDKVGKWIAAANENKTQPPVIYPISGEPGYLLFSTRFVQSNESHEHPEEEDDEESEVQLILMYGRKKPQYSVTLTNCEYAGDEILSVGTKQITFSESGELGRIVKGAAK